MKDLLAPDDTRDALRNVEGDKTKVVSGPFKSLDIESESVRVPKLANVPAAKFLTDTLAQVNATYHVKLDHILVLPKAKK